MTDQEWTQVVGILAANWPNNPPPDESIQKWGQDLREHDAGVVLRVLDSFYREGREFPPNGGQLLARIAEAERDDPDYGMAWQMINTALLRYAPYEWTKFYAYLQERSPSVAEAARRFNFESQGGYLVEDEPTVRAQFRDIFRAVVAERKRDEALGLGSEVRQLRGDGKPRKISDVLPRIGPGGRGA